MVMEIGGISKYIKDLIVDHDKVEVPRLGVFFARAVPAHFSQNRTAIYPPGRELYFTPSDPGYEDCDLLVDSIASSMSVSRDEARNELEWGIGRLLSELETNNLCILPGLGEVSGSGAELRFTPYGNLEMSPDSFGLEPVSLVPLSRKEEKKVKSPAKRMAKTSRIVYYVVGTAALIVLFFVTIYCFREQFSPFSDKVIASVDNILNHLLYNSEERALLGF